MANKVSKILYYRFYYLVYLFAKKIRAPDPVMAAYNFLSLCAIFNGVTLVLILTQLSSFVNKYLFLFIVGMGIFMYTMHYFLLLRNKTHELIINFFEREPHFKTKGKAIVLLFIYLIITFSVNAFAAYVTKDK